MTPCTGTSTPLLGESSPNSSRHGSIVKGVTILQIENDALVG